jgi:prepilin-type N-terminal cleavage/methylation domain-containing protein
MKKAFTLIELLVVIAIIGTLATLIIANIQGVRERGRDLRRKADLSSLEKSLRLFYNDTKAYPAHNSNYEIVGCTSPTSPTACTWGDAFAIGDTIYMSKIPQDPLTSNANPTTRYYYFRHATDTDRYLLLARLENASDAEITDSQLRCNELYNQFTSSFGASEPTKDYVSCTQ